MPPIAVYYSGMGKKSTGAELISTDAAAAALGLSPRQVRAHAAAGRLPAQRIGRDWLFQLADVLAFVPERVGRPKNT